MGHLETFDRKPRRGLAQPVLEAAGTFNSVWGTHAQRSGIRHWPA
jgi:hypothetical protein